MPKTPKRDRWYLRLDDYHRFVVKQISNVTGADKSAVLERMIVQWVGGHLDEVARAKAGMDDWVAVRDTWEDND